MSKLLTSTLLATAVFGLAAGTTMPACADSRYYDETNTYTVVPATLPASYVSGYSYVYDYGGGGAPVFVPVTYAADPYMRTGWHYDGLRHVPVRFGDLSVHEENIGNVWRSAVVFNGETLMQGDDQRGALEISQTFQLHDEDAVIVTAIRGEASCPVRNYLIIMRRDGSAPSPREIASCTNAHDAHVENNSLLISFPSVHNLDGWSTWNTWRYRNSSLDHI